MPNWSYVFREKLIFPRKFRRFRKSTHFLSVKIQRTFTLFCKLFSRKRKKIKPTKQRISIKIYIWVPVPGLIYKLHLLRWNFSFRLSWWWGFGDRWQRWWFLHFYTSNFHRTETVIKLMISVINPKRLGLIQILFVAFLKMLVLLVLLCLFQKESFHRAQWEKFCRFYEKITFLYKKKSVV